MDFKIFINYRREDNKGFVRLISDRFKLELGDENVIFDPGDIEAGDDWREKIARRIAACDVCLVIMGPDWLKLLKDALLLSPDDPVCYEIQLAIQNNKIIAPILIEDASAPAADDFPFDYRALHKFLDYRFEPVNNATNFDTICRRLIATIRHEYEPDSSLESDDAVVSETNAQTINDVQRLAYVEEHTTQSNPPTDDEADVTIILDIPIEVFNEVAERELLKFISTNINVSLKNIKVITIEPGSTVVRIRLPINAATELKKRLKENPDFLAKFEADFKDKPPIPSSPGKREPLIIPSPLNKVIGERYKILEEIGRGGMGVVYRGIHIVDDEPVAIKKIIADSLKEHPSRLERFRREIDTLRILKHPNIVEYLDTIEEESEIYLVMRFIDGQTLAETLAGNKNLSLYHYTKIGLDIARALREVHRRGIIHRDIKLSNIIVSFNNDYPIAYLTDFGIAFVENDFRLTKSNEFIGTYEYAAPETFSGKITPAADIWSLGVTIYKLMTRVALFEHFNLDYDLLPDGAPQIVRDMLDRMLQPKIQNRVYDVQDIIIDLRRIQIELQKHQRDAQEMEQIRTDELPRVQTNAGVIRQSPTTALPLTLRVMISSTSIDLPDHRQACIKAMITLDMLIRAMEYLTSEVVSPLDVSLSLVDDSDIYVGIFAQRYGYIPDDPILNPDKLSITELEFRRAKARDIPIIIFIQDDSAIIGGETTEADDSLVKLARLQEELTRDFTVSFFTTPDNLEHKVYRALEKIKSEKFPVPDPGSASIHRRTTEPGTQAESAISTIAERFDVLPHPPSYDLFGRENIIRQVKVNLLDDNSVGLWGIPGIGKTRILQEIAFDDDIQAYYDVILWASIGPESDFLSLFRTWAHESKIHPPDVTPHGIEYYTNILRKRLNDKHVLFLIDDVWAIQGLNTDIMTMLHSINNSNSTIMMTCLANPVARAFANDAGVIHVEALNIESGVNLMGHIAPTLYEARRDKLLEIVKAYDRIPDSLIKTARDLRKVSHQVKILDKAIKHLLERSKVNTGLQKNVYDYIVPRLSDAEQLILALLAMFPALPNSLSYDAVQAISQQDHDTMMSVCDSGLIYLYGDRFVIEPIVARYIRQNTQIAIETRRIIDYYEGLTKEADADVNWFLELANLKHLINLIKEAL